MFELFQKHFLDHFPRRKTTPAIRYNKVQLEKKLQAAVDRGDVTWEIIEEKVKLYAKSDTVAAGFIVLPATWCSETNDNGPGWSWEYEIPQSAEEILAAKPVSERSFDDWREILGKPTEFQRHWLKNHWNTDYHGPRNLCPAEILEEYGLEKNYG